MNTTDQSYQDHASPETVIQIMLPDSWYICIPDHQMGNLTFHHSLFKGMWKIVMADSYEFFFLPFELPQHLVLKRNHKYAQ
jgi:hypothetical protein